MKKYVLFWIGVLIVVGSMRNQQGPKDQGLERPIPSPRMEAIDRLDHSPRKSDRFHSRSIRSHHRPRVVRNTPSFIPPSLPTPPSIPEVSLDSRRERPAAGTRYHEITRLHTGVRVGSLGAMSYLIDKKGKAFSDGYHTIQPDNDGGYTATCGAKTFHLDSKGEVIVYTK